MPPLAYRGVVAAYNLQGARVFLVPAAYDPSLPWAAAGAIAAGSSAGGGTTTGAALTAAADDSSRKAPTMKGSKQQQAAEAANTLEAEPDPDYLTAFEDTEEYVDSMYEDDGALDSAMDGVGGDGEVAAAGKPTPPPGTAPKHLPLPAASKKTHLQPSTQDVPKPRGPTSRPDTAAKFGRKGPN